MQNAAAQVRAMDRPHSGGVKLPGALATPLPTQFHVLSFEGPDPYSRAGGLATRVHGICETLVAQHFDTHLWFVGDPQQPGHISTDGLALHRWCQWVSQYHTGGVYDGEQGKVAEYGRSLPPYLMREHLLPHLRRGGMAVILAEEWQTVGAVLHLDHLLRQAQLRHRVRLMWNANNVFGFHSVDWPRLRQAALITTVSRYMKQLMSAAGIEAIAIPNGLAKDAYQPPDRFAVAQLRRCMAGRLTMTKMARWDPDKGWLATVGIIAALHKQGCKPQLIARGGNEAHGIAVLRAFRDAGLRVVERSYSNADPLELAGALASAGGADVVLLTTHIDPGCRRALFRACDIVLANSEREPFGFVALEAMAVGGMACTGFSGEDYAIPGHNALVLQTSDPEELLRQWAPLASNSARENAVRRAGRVTAKHFAWPEILRRNLLPRLELEA